MPALYTKTREEAGFTTTSEGQNESLLSFFLSAVGAKPASEQEEAGFTILFAVIVIAAVLTLGLTITGIFQRETLLTTSSQASSEAFYAADAALECAMYHDRKENTFATSSAPGNVDCAGASNVNVTKSGSSYPYEFTFRFDNTEGDNICAGVTVTKRISGGEEITQIESRGRDTCQENPRQAERALRTAY